MADPILAIGATIALQVEIVAVEADLFLLAPRAGPRFWLNAEQILRRDSPQDIRVGDRVRDVSRILNCKVVWILNCKVVWIIAGIDGDEAWCRSAAAPFARATFLIANLRRLP